MFDVNSEFSASTKQRTAVHGLFYIPSRVAAYIFILRVNHSLRPTSGKLTILQTNYHAKIFITWNHVLKRNELKVVMHMHNDIAMSWIDRKRNQPNYIQILHDFKT